MKRNIQTKRAGVAAIETADADPETIPHGAQGSMRRALNDYLRRRGLGVSRRAWNEAKPKR